MNLGGRNLYCYRCGHSWTQEGGARPRLCPRCRTSVWDVPVSRQARCSECGCEWTRGRIDEPCPECGASSDESPGMLHCNQCDHTWSRRTSRDPKRCPVCRSDRWNLPRDHRLTCYRCGHVWRNRSDHPDRCPSCQSMRWDEPTYRLQCRRCGYKWTTRDGRTSEDISLCPSCKSRKWNEVPEIRVCNRCGRSFIPRSHASDPKCPHCSSTRTTNDNRCPFCGMEWSSVGDWSACPRCGKERQGSDRSMEIWSDGMMSLRYVFTDGMAFVYLWNGNIPEATIYFRDLLRRTSLTASQAMLRFSDPVYDSLWRSVAEDMMHHRDDYLDDVPYLSKRLNIVESDAIILAIHFTGMGPEAISVRFGLSL
ncbi:MAG: hypothetical protein ACI381_07210, partial [Candidatus Methanomethylophilaceae archaeon]